VKSFFTALPANPDDRNTKQSAVPVDSGSGLVDVADGSFAAAPSLSLRDIVDAGSPTSASPAASESGAVAPPAVNPVRAISANLLACEDRRQRQSLLRTSPSN